jgi:hypothetical protein
MPGKDPLFLATQAYKKSKKKSPKVRRPTDVGSSSSKSAPKSSKKRSASPTPRTKTTNAPSSRHGVKTWANGNRYDGEFKGNKLHGRGVYTWANGHRYDGEFKGNKLHGRGVKTWANGNVYEGEWKDNKQHGHGVKTWNDGDVYDGDVYEGEWKDNKQHGHGVYNGHGVYTCANGDVYDGEWKYDKQHRHDNAADAAGAANDTGIAAGEVAARYFDYDGEHNRTLEYAFIDWLQRADQMEIQFQEWERGDAGVRGMVISDEHRAALEFIRNDENQKIYFQRLYGMKFFERRSNDSGALDAGKSTNPEIVNVLRNVRKHALYNWRLCFKRTEVLALAVPQCQVRIGDVDVPESDTGEHNDALKKLAEAAPKF